MCPLIYKFLRSRIKQSSKTQGFTLTELIVVITILSILSVIGFSVMSHQSSVARDGKRISDIKTLSESARITSAQLRKLPTPIADSVSLTVSGSFIGYQGFMSLALVNPLGYGSDKIFDPKDNIPYTYRVNQHYDQAQFLAYLENPRFERTIEIAKQSLPSTLPSLVSKAYAGDTMYPFDTAYALDSSSIDLSKRYPYSAGDRLGIFLTKGSRQPLQNGVTGTGSRDISLSDASTLDIIVGSQGSDEYVSTDISTGSLLALKNGTFDEKALLGMNSATGSSESGSGTGSEENHDVGYTMANRIGTAVIHSCLLKTDGTVTCWGSDNDILFHSGTGLTTVPAGLNNVTSVDTGWAGFNCALKTDKTVTCWGGSGAGMESFLGDNLAQIDMGFTHGCGVHTDGTVSCGGNNDEGQSSVPVGLSNAVQVSAGYTTSCALKNDGTIVCWGSNDYGELDIPEGLSGVTQVSVGMAYICALKSDTSVICWGNGGVEAGQNIVPQGLSGVTQISAGLAETCAVKNDTTLTCWGYAPLMPPSGLTGITQVSVGYFHACAVKSGNDGVCWGVTDNIGDYGQATWSATPVPPAPPINLAFMREPLDLSASCVVQGGKSFCSGNGWIRDIDGITDVKQANGRCILKNNGDVMCARDAGGDTSVQLAKQNTLQGAEYIEDKCAIFPNSYVSCYQSPSLSVNFQIPGVYDLSEGRTSSLNHDFTCALKNDGTVECWGDNAAGQTNVPSGLSNVRRIVSTSLGKTCALKNDGTVTCWGSNIGSSMSAPSPASNEKFQRIDPYLGGFIAIRQNGSAVFYIPSALSSYAPSYLLTGYANAQAIVGMCAKYADNSISCGGTGPHELKNVSKIKPLYAVVGSVSSGITGTCYILTNGDVKCGGAQSNLTSNFHNKTNVRDIATLVSGSSTKWCLVKTNNTLECDSETTATFDIVPSNVSSFFFLNISSGVPGWCMIDTNDTLNCKTGPYSWNISNVANVHKVVSNENQVCALMNDGTNTCWNYNNQSESHPFPASKDIIANDSIICSHTYKNTVTCTGGSGYGQYENDDATNTTAGTIIYSLSNVTGIYADKGTSQMCAATISGQIRCWNTSSAYSPASLDSGAPNVGEPIKKLMLDGNQFGCYLTYTGHVGCWGYMNMTGYPNVVTNIPDIMSSEIDNIFSVDDDPNRTSTSVYILKDGNVGEWGSEYQSYNTSNVASFSSSPFYFLDSSSQWGTMPWGNEGDTINITVTTVGVPDNTVIPYSITGIDANDLSSGDLSGNVIINNGSAQITLTLTADQTTEDTEIMHINLDNGSGILDIGISDTSMNP